MACYKLERVNGQSGIYTTESINQLQNFIRKVFGQACDNSDNGNDAKLLKHHLKKALYQIGDNCDQRQINEIIKQIDIVSNEEDFEGISEFFPEAGLFNTLSIKNRVQDLNEKTQDDYLESESTMQEIISTKNQFLDNFLGNKSKIKNQLKQNVTHKLLSTFIIDRENGRLITNITEANKQARKYKQELLNIVMEYLKNTYPNLYNIEDYSLYNDDKYTGILSNIKHLTKFLDDYSPSQLQDIYNDNPNKYNAIVSWFTLKNFDNFVDLLLGDVIKINPEYKNTFKDGDGYIYSDKGTNVITSWRTNDNIILEHEIGALAQSLINSTPFYKKGINNKTGKFIKFEDFYRMITKLKDLSIDPKTKNIIINNIDYPYLFGPNSDLSKQEQDLIENKSLRTIINNIRMNPQVYARLAMRLLVQGDIMDTLNYTEEEKDKTWSIYKGFFSSDDKESIYNIQNKDVYDHNVKNYYSLITQVADSLFSVDFLQYSTDENGIITVRTLKDQNSDIIRKRIEMGIAGFNSKNIIGTNFETYQMEPYNMKPLINESTNKFEGITFVIEREDDFITDKNYDLYITVSNLGETITIQDSNGNYLSGSDLFVLDYDILNFIDSQLNLGLVYDKDFVDAIRVVYKDKGESVAVKELLHIASVVYMNKYISNVLLNNIKGKKNSINKLKEIFQNSEYNPGFNTTLGEINVFPSKLINELTRIAEAKSITTGEAQSAQVRDAEGNMLSSQTLSRLLGSLQSQWERILGSPDNAAYNFSLLQSNLFKGCYTNKEFKSLLGNKEHIKFTVSESIQGNFLYDFVGGFLNFDNISGKQIIGNGIVGFLPSVNSDKNTIGRMLINLYEECKVKGIDSITLQGKNKTWAELTVSELEQIICKELGDYYNKSWENIVKDFQELEKWLRLTKNLNVIINPDNNFKELNQYASELNKSTSKLLFEWTKEYNKTHSKPIRLIEQTHYVKNGKEIKTNNTFKALRNRYNNPQKLHEFMQMKRTEVLKSLVDENFEINLYSDSNDKQTPKRYLLNNYPDWVNGNNIKNGKMVIAKLTYNGNIYNITGKNDLLEFNTLFNRSNKSVDFIKNPHELLNPKYGINIELHPMLDKYNTMDYLFTQEFMIAGVGSHINHPAKVSYKTPIIWAHPGIGKTYTIQNTQYKDQIIDWDEEFNFKRDQWIEKISGTIKGTESFKEIRNEYLINWENHADFQEFVKKEWERVKTLANSQNKMLVASPHMLLQLFPDDFNQILTMDRDDFIQRNVARGANDAENSALWKDGIDATINSMATNPVYGKKVTVVGKGEYLQNMLDNGKLYDVLAQLRENEMQEEAARFLAQHKRNVSYTAAMHEFQLGTITGIPTIYNMAIIDDYTAPVYTISGDSGEHAPLDGATFVNPFVVIWENNSLGDSKAGIDKKQFVHYYDEETGTGGIIKTAGFGLTNDRIRRYQFYRDMMYNMTSKRWKDQNGNDLIMDNQGILSDFNGNNVEYGPIYFKRGNKYYMREINSYAGNNSYNATLIEIDKYGDAISDGVEELIENVNSNYDVWKMFGGHNSLELKNGELIPSEKSIILTTKATNNYGKLKQGVTKAISADDVWQPMKTSDIHYMPTVGAIKQGACNVNPSSHYYGKHDLNFMQVKMYQAGIQLDKEHHADNSELSLMTQVISAACANGYSFNAAKKLYNAIYQLTKVGTIEFRNELGDLLIGNIEKFDKAVSKIIIDAIMNSTSTDGDLVQIIAQNLISEMRKTKDFSFNAEFYDKVKTTIPNSDPTIYPKIVNMLTVALTKSGIKTKMPGILAVLCPSHEILKFYKIPAFDEQGLPTGKYKRVTIDKLEEFYNTDDLNSILDLLQEEELFLQHPSEIEMGYKYLITHTDGTQEVVHINRIHGEPRNEGFREYKGRTIQYSEISYEHFKKMDLGLIQEWVKEGQDLKSYNVRFEDLEGNKYQIADLDIVKDYFKLKQDLEGDDQLRFALNLLSKYDTTKEFIERVSYELRKSWGDDLLINQFIRVLQTNPQGIIDFCNNYKNNNVTYGDLGVQFKEYLNKRLIHFINRQLQISLDGISPKGNIHNVRVNGKLIQINKESIKTSTFGLVMPKTFKSNLGLDEFDDLEDIKNDPMFFVKKLANKFGTKVEIYEDENGNFINNYHVELKRSNGNHIYIRKGLSGSDLVKEVHWFKRIDENGNVFRIDSNNKIMYQMHSSEDKIYQDFEGNEIIVTTEDSVRWEDIDGNEIDFSKVDAKKSANGIWIDSNTGKELVRKFDSGIQFYLDTFDYNSFSISRGCSDLEFKEFLNKAKISTNQTAAKLAKNILNKGAGKKPQQQLLEQRKLVNAMNDYNKMINDPELKDFAMIHLKELGEEMYTSFLRSLDIIAARIPAQSQQSFMSMQVECYENPDVNSAYVSLFQFYLQGSDLDIDAVSLQTFELNYNGLYIGHSPYYNLTNEEFRKVSDELPFPTGIEIIPKKVDHIRDTTLGYMLQFGYFGFSNKLNYNSLFNLNPKKDGTVTVELNLNSTQNLNKFIKFLEKINRDGFSISTESEYIKFINALSDKFPDTGQFTIEMINSITEQIIKIVNDHNLYIRKSKPKKREQIIKNYITLQLREIIDDPINRRQADSSVDVVTGPAKNLSKTSPKATVQTTFTPGNVVNKFQSISENMVGKDGIAICATGLKSFFAITEMHQEILNRKPVDKSIRDSYEINKKIIEDKNKLLFEVPFRGKIYKGLANGFSLAYKSPYEHNLTPDEKQILDEMYSQQVQDYLLDQFWASDAANEMSALLGLSTDNAKELVLAKINAGTSSIGMYLYGISIGIPFDQLFQVMTSPLAFRLTELTKGDFFNKDSGTINIIGALNYLKKEPIQQLLRFNDINLSEYKDLDSPSQLLSYNIIQVLKGLYKSEDKLNQVLEKGVLQALIHSVNTLEEGLNILDSLVGKLNGANKIIKDEYEANKYEILYNQAIEFSKQYLRDAFLIKNGTFNPSIYKGSFLIDDLEILATGAEEMKQIGKILRLNQEIKTNTSDLIAQVNNIEEAIIRRAKKLKDQLARKGINVFNYKGDPEIKKIIFNKNLEKPISEGGYRIDLEKFMTDPVYSEQVIDLYDTIKQSYNPLKIIQTVPHYKGYTESLLISYKGLKEKSVKFKLINTRVQSFINEYSINDTKLKEQVVKNAERGIDLYIRQDWMRKTIKPITLPASSKNQVVYAFIDSASKIRVLNYNTEIQLGTELGDANFKLWMETVIIPYLKKQYPDNIFIRNLQPVVNIKTNIGSISVNYGLPINMLPKTDYERDLFNEYKEGFNSLISIKKYPDGAGNLFNLRDLFYYYSLIVNGGRVGPNSMHGIFEDYIETSIPTNFREFESKADSNPETFSLLYDFLSDEMLAPFSSPYTTGSRIIKYKDNDTGNVNLYIKPNKKQESSDQSGYNDYYEIEGYEDAYFQAYENAFGPNMQESYDSEINGFEKQTKNIEFHNKDNKNYFQNPIIVTGLSDIKTITLNEEEIKEYPTLSRFNIQVTQIKSKNQDKIGLVDITSSNPNDSDLIKRYLDKIRKETNGTLVSFNTTDGQIMVNKKQLNSELEALENNCI